MTLSVLSWRSVVEELISPISWHQKVDKLKSAYFAEGVSISLDYSKSKIEESFAFLILTNDAPPVFFESDACLYSSSIDITSILSRITTPSKQEVLDFVSTQLESIIRVFASLQMQCDPPIGAALQRSLLLNLERDIFKWSPSGEAVNPLDPRFQNSSPGETTKQLATSIPSWRAAMGGFCLGRVLCGLFDAVYSKCDSNILGAGERSHISLTLFPSLVRTMHWASATSAVRRCVSRCAVSMSPADVRACVDGFQTLVNHLDPQVALVSRIGFVEANAHSKTLNLDGDTDVDIVLMHMRSCTSLCMKCDVERSGTAASWFFSHAMAQAEALARGSSTLALSQSLRFFLALIEYQGRHGIRSFSVQWLRLLNITLDHHSPIVVNAGLEVLLTLLKECPDFLNSNKDSILMRVLALVVARSECNSAGDRTESLEIDEANLIAVGRHFTSSGTLENLVERLMGRNSNPNPVDEVILKFVSQCSKSLIALD